MLKNQPVVFLGIQSFHLMYRSHYLVTALKLNFNSDLDAVMNKQLFYECLVNLEHFVLLYYYCFIIITLTNPMSTHTKIMVWLSQNGIAIPKQYSHTMEFYVLTLTNDTLYKETSYKETLYNETRVWASFRTRTV